MDPITLITAGSAAIRAITGLFGGKTAEIGNKTAEVIDSVKALPAAIQQQKVQEHLASLPPEALVELKKAEVQLAEIAKDREANQLASVTAQVQAREETARSEAASTDMYVRRTRPMLARRSMYCGFAYIAVTGVAFPILNAVYAMGLPGPDWAIAGTFFAPMVAYTGARSFGNDKKVST